MRIAVVAGADPLNLRTWSGTPYFMTKALQEQFPDLLPVKAPRPAWLHFVRRAARRATAGRVDLFWSRSIARWSADQLGRSLKQEKVDVAVCIANAPLSAFLPAHVPTVHVSDATVPLMRDYYLEFSSLSPSLARSALQLDRESVLNARACLFSTEWAAKSAIRDYGADPARIHAVPWGANMEHGRGVGLAKPFARTDVCHLVFIGVDWERKGGAIAVEATRRLLAAGRDVKLHIIGAAPNLTEQDDAIIVHGFLNKGTQEGRARFDRIMRDAAFLFVPTRQDCSPMVFPEANAYSVPVITTATGGVPDVVQDGINGHLLPVEADAASYADLIWAAWSDRQEYDRLRASSHARFSSTLNWQSWLTKAAPVISASALS